MQKISPKTLFVGSRIIQLPSCESTNSVALELLYKNEATEGTVVTTLEQTKGRGQRGNSWEAEAGQNITLSLVLFPRFLAVSQQFYLNMAVSLAALEVGQAFLSPLVTIKWPNDLFLENKKWGGILIENGVSGNRLQHAVVGIGLNVNQTEFGSPQATSFSLHTGNRFYLPDVISLLLERLEKRYLELRELNFAKLRQDYLAHLYRFQKWGAFEVDGQKVSGKILGVAENGQLSVQVEGQVRGFSFKEIAYLF